MEARGAVAIAKAAEACAGAGDAERARTIMLDVEQPLYEAATLPNAERACCIGARSFDESPIWSPTTRNGHCCVLRPITTQAAETSVLPSTWLTLHGSHMAIK